MSNLKDLVKKSDTVLLDVRSNREYASGHIPGARNIPIEEIPYKAEELKSINSPIVVYCLSGGRSGMAVNILKQIGVANVYNGGGLGDMQYLIN
jgi:phage shock protein E